MFTTAVIALVITAVQTEIQGWTIHSYDVWRKSEDQQHKRDSVLDLFTNTYNEGTARGLRKAIENFANQTHRTNNKVGSGLAASFGKMPAAHSLDLRLEGIRSDDLGTKRISRLITNSLRGDVKPTPSDSFRDQASVTQFKNAKMFWNHFLFRKRSDTHTILPINNIEVLQQTCRALPFLQTVAHENCEKMVLRNNLCFGKCSSIHVPGNEDGHYAFCSYCFPVRFTRKTVQLNCKGSLQVTKVVMMVEDCQCEVQKGSHPHQPGPFLMDPSHLGNRAEESRHDTYY